MSTIESFLSRIRKSDIRLIIENENLKIKAPLGALTESLKKEIAARKKEILDFLKTADRTVESKTEWLHPVDRTETMQLSYAQERLWFLYQFEGPNSTYNIPFALRISGKIDLEAFEKSFQSIVDRHEVFRTGFKEEDGIARQEIADQLDFPIEYGHTTESEIHEVAVQHAQAPFDLEKAPLLRVGLLEIGQDDHLLLINMHHIISDRISIEILMHEFTRFYSAFSSGRQYSIPPLPVQYADFVICQRNRLEDGLNEKQLAYWLERLRDLPPLLELPLDYPRPPVQTYHGAKETFNLPEDLRMSLRQLSQQEGASLFMIGLAVFQTLLSKVTGSTDIAVGSPIANRSVPELKPLIGFFVNTLVLRTEINLSEGFRDNLRRVKKTCLEAYEHQDTPFEQLVEHLNLPRSLSYSPLFQVMFIFQEAFGEESKLPGLTINRVESELSVSKFDLTLSLTDGSSGLSGSIEYNSDLFGAEKIRRIIGYFVSLLKNIVLSPDTPLSGLDMMTPEEKHQLLVEWNDTQTDYPKDQCLHELFETQVKRSPYALATVFEEQIITYQELNEQSNQLARYLHDHHVKTESFVCVYMERSLEMLIGILGILKAGATYVPIDPEYPQKRVAFILEDTQAPFVLTTEKLGSALGLQEPRLLSWESFNRQRDRFRKENVSSKITSDNAAYVLFTSGSTGTPKGVVVEHQSAVDLICWSQRRFPIQALKGVFASTSICFDLSIFEIFVPLSVGGLIVLGKNALDLPNHPRRHHVKLINTVPSAFAQLLSLEAIPNSVTHVNLAGESFQYSLVEQGYALGHIQEIHNLYGPSEDTTYSTFKRLDRTQPPFYSIGRPIDNTTIYLLDSNQQVVPIGVVGEIHIGGDSLARCYWNRQDLTQEKFIPNPFEGNKTSRLYKTGDLGRYHADGEIEYLGRLDDQVKIRGFRIELGEIESVLNRHHAVKESVVIDQEIRASEKQLAAYYTIVDQTSENDDLSAFLKDRLPGYMIPSALIKMERLPRTPNGKIDRNALPKPDFSNQIEKSYVVPETSTQKILADIWAGVLELDKVGLYDNLFEIGGHSLIATRIISRIHKELGIKLDLKTLFLSPTIHQLDTAIRKHQKKEALYRLYPVSRDNPLPLSFAQQRLWFICRLEGAAATYNMPAALKIEGDIHVDDLRRSFQEIINRHEVFRTGFKEVDGEPIQEIEPYLELGIERLEVSEKDIPALIAEENAKPFDLKKPPLIRVKLLVISDKESVLLVNMHHIISDGWSIGVLIREFSQLYNAVKQRLPSPLEDLPIQYADFAYCQRKYAPAELFGAQIDYWKQKLSGMPPLLELPVDHPRPPIQTYKGATESFRLSKPLIETLHRFGQETGASLFMTLLAAFKILLFKYTGSNDIAVGTLIANRTRSELEDLIGFFLNTLVLRSRINPDGCFQELLSQLKQTTLEAYDHQDLPFEYLLDQLQLERNLSYSPLIQVMCVMQNTPVESIELTDVNIHPIKSESLSSKFDLTMYLTEGEMGLTGSLEYRTDLFDRDTICRMIGHFEMLLEQIVTHRERSIHELKIIKKPEREQLLVEWNNVKGSYSKDKCISELFEEQVAEAPHRIAVVFEKQAVSYLELSRYTDRMAAFLIEQGVTPGKVIGIDLNRSPEMLVGVLAVLKVGGIFVPLDPKFPDARKRFLLDDSDSEFYLTSNLVESRVAGFTGRTILLDSLRQIAHIDSDGRLPKYPDHDDIAYQIYTSGSTGVPKGVLKNHGALVNCLQSLSKQPGLDSDDVLLAVSSLSFDISPLELLMPLICGARIVLASDDDVVSGLRLAELIEEHQVTIMQATPVTWEMLIEAGLQVNPDKFRAFYGGEKMSKKTAIKLSRQCRSIINLYGTTETSIWSTYHDIAASDELETSIVGRPIDNTPVYILDAGLNPVPVGVYGEIYIGGVGVCDGYLNRPELTADRFIPDPFGDTPGARLSRTGDWGRFRTDGNIELSGRLDNQVKVRGHRIELGEIEAVLAQHELVQKTAVICQDAPHIGKQLVAYVCRHETKPEVSELREYLTKKIPDYMIPSVIVVLDEFPLTGSGKIDRKALPEPDLSGRSQYDFVAPETDLQKLLASIWSSVLGLDKVGIHDNFFEIGSHSLLITKVVSRIESELNVTVEFRSFFLYATIFTLSAHLETLRKPKSRRSIPTVSRNRPLPLSFAQQRLWFLDQYEGGSAIYNMPFAIRIKGKLELDIMERSFSDIVQRHEALRTGFKESSDGNPVQFIGPADKFRIHYETTTESELKSLIRRHANEVFDLSDPPLIRVKLLKIETNHHVLLINMHHIISDGWSLDVMIEEFKALYQGYASGVPFSLKPLSIQYADYASYQQERLNDPLPDQKLIYWKQKLSDLPPLLPLPLDRPRPVQQTFNGQTVSVGFSQTLMTLLKELSWQQGTTLYMTFLAAFHLLLSKYTGSFDIAVGSPVSNRTEPELEHMIGFFVNTLVLRSKMSPEQTFIELLDDVKETTLEAYENQEIPFELLVDHLNVERSISHSPLIQVMFQFDAVRSQRLKFSEIELSYIMPDFQVAKFDLSFSINERSDDFIVGTNFNRDIFDETTVRQFIRQYKHILEQVVSCPDAPYHQITLMTSDPLPLARLDAQKEVNGSEPPDSMRDGFLHSIIQKQAMRRPDKIAVVCRNEYLTYGELNRRVEYVAHFLIEQGAGKGTRIAVCADKTMDSIMAPLAIWKIGGTYIPIDATHPEQRIRLILKDSQSSLLLVNTDKLADYTFDDVTVHPMKSLHQDHQAFQPIDHDFSSAATGDQIAYIIYTSGSTGVPKGVAVSQKNLLQSFESFKTAFGFNEADQMPCLASEAFDISIFELFQALKSGGTVVLMSRPEQVDLSRLTNVMRTATRLNILPGLAKELVNYWQAEHQKQSLKSAIESFYIGGDAVPDKLLQDMRLCWPRAEIVQTYGPTEGTIMSTYHINRPQTDSVIPSLIGKPFDHVTTRVMDPYGNPLPAGIVGELTLSGQGVAGGYLNRPDLTSEKFLPDSWSEEGGVRCYRTGDLVKELPSGELEFKGRIDNQIKIRGFRVELGEVEAAILASGGVQDVCVQQHQLDNGSTILIGYVVSDAPEFSRSQLKEALSQRLPDYMIPTALIQMDRLPLTPNGKIDTKALPKSAFDVLPKNDRKLPKTPRQELLASIWSEVLKLEMVGITDNFFDIGGNSLTAIRVRSRIREVMGVDLKLEKFFTSPTIEQLDVLVRSTERLTNPVRLTPVSRDRDLPLSFAQQRLWFIECFEGRGGAYNIPLAIRLRGKINPEALTKTFQEIISRHDVFQTRFVHENGVATQVIDRSISFQLNINDVEPKGLKQAIQAHAQISFDLEKGPLFRIELLRVDDDDHVLLFNIHHIISDAWSFSIIVNEFSQIYSGLVEGRVVDLPKPKIQYADYAVRQRETLQGEELEHQKRYWLEQLDGLPTHLNQPTDHPRSHKASYAGATESFSLNSDISSELNRICRDEHVTLYMLLLASFQVLLSKYTGHHDVVVGSPTAGRSHAELENLVGCFVNTLVLRSQVHRELPFRTFLSQVKQTTLEAFDHQDMPFELLVDLISPERSAAHHPLFQVMFSLENAPGDQLDFSGIQLSIIDSDYHVAKFDLSLSMVETDQGLRGQINYNCDLFEQTTICRMRDHLINLLNRIAANPGRRISDLSIMTDVETHRMLRDWNHTKKQSERFKYLHKQFEEQVLKTPDSIAVSINDCCLSYRRLNEKSNQLAHFLIEKGIGPEEIVGISTERSLEMIVGILGVLKAGAAYLPLVPTIPENRLQYMMKDSEVSILLTQSSLPIELNNETFEIYALDGTTAWNHYPVSNPTVAIDPLNACYVIYTSGSTGMPKGVITPHLGIGNLLNWNQAYFKLNCDDRVLQKTSFGFDVSVWELLWPITIGATLRFAKPGGEKDARYLVSEVSKESVSVIHFVPSMLNAFLEEAGGDHLKQLRQVQCGGEALSLNSQTLFHKKLKADLFNLYGPTEAAIGVTVYKCEQTDQYHTVPIGKPIFNIELYILDEDLNPVPAGVYGELCIGGLGLARGYLNRPELTAETFIPNPFDANPGVRLYKTGDRCRFLADGNIEYSERIDHQVKIRGFRIELGEIESHLLLHPHIKEVAVQVHETNESIGRQLVAYVVSDQITESLDEDEVRSFLATQLPDYMIPAAFVELEALPLSPSGKLDRKALPALDVAEQIAQGYVAPETELQHQLVAIWSEVLGLEQVGIHDNFFKVGGHSLLATQVVSRIRQNLLIDVSLRSLFTYPTINDLSRQLIADDQSAKRFSIQPVSRTEVFPLSFAQNRLWFLSQFTGSETVYHMPISLKISGKINIEAFDLAFREIVDRHEIFRTGFKMNDGEPIQVIDQTLVFKPGFELITEDEADRRIRDFFREPFNLRNPPLLRVNLLKISEEDYILLINMHHIVSDGWSIGVMIREFMKLYSAFDQQKPSPLKPLRVQYADFSYCQRKYLSGPILEKEIAYWKHKLAGLPPLLELPTDRARPSRQTYCGETISFKIADSLSRDLHEHSRQEGTTLFMTLLAAFNVLIWKYSGSRDFAVGTPVANRMHPELEDLIGFFVNMLVLRSNINPEQEFTKFLSEVKETAIEAFEHQELPFEILVDQLNAQRNLSHTPLFQVLFALQNAPTDRLELSGIELTRMEQSSDAARFDLSLVLTEQHNGLVGDINYNNDLFDASTIRQMIDHFSNLLSEITGNPHKKLFELEVLSEKEKRHLLRLGKNIDEHELSVVTGTCIHDLFRQQAAQTPDAVAVVIKDHQLTYRELDEKSDRMANYLLAECGESESLVGVCMGRIPALVVGILGVLKAGKAYVPVEPSQPMTRLQYIFANSDVTSVIVDQDAEKKLDGQLGAAMLIRFDIAIAGVKQSPRDCRELNVSPDVPAYVIYTSGSTGTPKGVIVTHRNVGRLFDVTYEEYRFDQNDIWSLFHSFAFDFSVWEIWGALFYGGKLVMASESDIKDPERFYTLLRDQRITVLNQTPSAFYALQKIVPEHPDCLTALRLVIFGGEALDFRKLEPWIDVFGDQSPKLYNMYGITETTVHITYQLITKAAVKGGCNGLIGVPLRDLNLYILDEFQKPTPQCIAGEICISGAGVSNGYINAAELTAEKFIADPFSDNPDLKLYRTGDLARINSDGNIEYLGRLDHQVKIRGFRIEVGEIESVLSLHDDIHETVVVDQVTTNSDTILVAYITLEEGRRFNESLIRAYLRTKLPDYMIPSAFMIVERFPLTSNGKIDRKSLPLPNFDDRIKDEYVGPKTVEQELIADIWADVLGLERVGIYDNFFEIGGHSLLATQVLSRIQKVLQVKIDLHTLFSHATVAQVSEAVQANNQTESLYPLYPVSRKNDLPLSFAQQRLWFLYYFEDTKTNYNMPFALWINGTLCVKVLEDSFREIVRRHEILRTGFVMEDHDKRPRQVIDEQLDFRIHVKSVKSSEVAEHIRNNAHIRFDLEKPPLLHVCLLKLEENSHILLLNMHHIIADGWSLQILIKEVSILYETFAAGEPSPLPELPIQYADFAYCRQNSPVGDVLEKEVKYWKERLKGLPPLLELPTDFPRPTKQTFRGASEPVNIPAALLSELKTLSRRQGTTLFMTLLAAFDILLYKYTGSREVVVGSPIANRTRPELENLIGFFVNTLALNATVAPESSFIQFLQTTKQTTLEAYDHQEVPFEYLVDHLGVDRSLSYSPLFQVMFALQNIPTETVNVSGIEIMPMESDVESAKFDLTVILSETRKGLSGSISYNRDLFESKSIRQMIAHYENILREIVQNPQKPISQIQVLSTEDRISLLNQLDKTKNAPSDNRCVQHLFEEQVAKTPDAVAVTFDEFHVTYKELNQITGQLADRLCQKGVGPNVCVAICMDRSIEMVSSVIAVLKSGGAYLPIDPELPQDRISFMIDDSQCRLVLSGSDQYQWFDKKGAPVWTLRELLSLPNAGTQDGLPESVTSEDLAYVIYTSGSTGKPKGVSLSHLVLVNLIEWTKELVPEAGGDRTLQYTTFSFDVFFQEVFSTITQGGTLVLIRQDERVHSETLLHFLQRHAVEHLHMPYTALVDLTSTGNDESIFPNCLKTINTAGEQLKINHEIKRFVGRLKGCCLMNHYGPAETHVATSYTLDSTPDTWSPLPPIGQPIPNAKLMILDADGQIVPIGVTGELYIGGRCLGKGYLHNPGLTDEKFLTLPLENGSTDDFYKSGDLVRYSGNGIIEYKGRVDTQVKIRGIRVEPNEIEKTIQRHDAVKGAVVEVRSFSETNKILIAFIVVHQHKTIEPSDLKKFLATQLPDYMIPAYFHQLDYLPVTPTGKVDRKALPEFDVSDVIRKKYVAPHTALEKSIAAIWTEVLGLDAVGIHDGFFEIGGHSLSATQVVSRIRKTLDISLELKSIFTNPTISELAEHIATITEKAVSFPLKPVSREEQLPLSYAQQRLWFLDQFEGAAPVYNLPIVLRVTGNLDYDALEKSFAALVKRHEGFRTGFKTNEGIPYQFVMDAPDFKIACERSDQTEVSDHVRSFVQQPFDLQKPPLLRVKLLTIGKREHLLMINMHHIISDGWSMGILVREATALYASFQSGKPPEMEDLPIQYGDFAYCQRRYWPQESIDRDLNFWREALLGVPSFLPIPTDRPRPRRQTFNGADESIGLSGALTDALKALSQAEGGTLFMTLLAAFQILLAKLSGTNDIPVGTPIANRTRPELESLIGFFVNTLVLRSQVDFEQTFTQFLSHVRQTTLEAYEHQEVPFEYVVDQLNIDRSLSHSPLFQAMFILQNMPMETMSLPDIEWSFVESDFHVAKFDVTLSLAETGQGIVGGVNYNRDLFEPHTIQRMIGLYTTILSQIANDPDRPLQHLVLLTEDERNRQLVQWNPQVSGVHSQKTVCQLFQEQVGSTPDAIAIQFGTHHLTFRELNRLADQTAQQLVDKGIKPGMIVGTALERSPQLVAACIGIMKTGGVYAPLDPTHPKKRLEWILADLGQPLVITSDSITPNLPDGTATLTIARLKESTGSDAFPVITPEADRTAYILYTSGSTGKPKGVKISHKSLANYLSWARKTYCDGKPSAFPLFTPITFDLTVTSLFLPLITSGRLVIYPDRQNDSITPLFEVIEDRAVDVVKLTPSHLTLIVDRLAGNKRLKSLIVGGEAFKTELASTVRNETRGRVSIYNEYGPTEATVGCIVHRYDPKDDKTAMVPIGHPITDMSSYILDAHLNLLPVGVVGDLYLSGVGLADGYHANDRLTQERFIKHRLDGHETVTLYQTGDRARYLPDGTIEYLGREDDQIQIRGYRIESAEIESVLKHMDAIDDAAVTVYGAEGKTQNLAAYVTVTKEALFIESVLKHMDAIDDAAVTVYGAEGKTQNLAAYVTVTKEALFDEDAAKRYLRSTLPEYMIPSAIVKIDRLPLNHNGKLDHRALPSPDFADRTTPGYVAPQTELQHLIADIWQELLELDAVGIHRNFFDLGGNSMLIVQLHAKLKQKLDTDFSIVDLFTFPNIAQFSEYFEQQKAWTPQRSRNQGGRTKRMEISKIRKQQNRRGV